jgi:hypothetical protein
MVAERNVTIQTAATLQETRAVEPVFGRYVTQNDGFVKHLHAVRDQLNNYVAKISVRRPLNILLAAPPGSGKSFLIKQLIESIDTRSAGLELSFEEVYIASLEDASELYSIFQRVQSLNLEGKLPCVFFDEVDTAVGDQAIYPKFLAPMWDGTFYVGKDKFFLGRSVFFFAGSTLSLEEESKDILDAYGKSEAMSTGELLSYESYFEDWKKKFDAWCKSKSGSSNETKKLLDFIDRIDATLRIPPIKRELLGDEGLRREYEDLAFMLIRKHFPKVTNIGKEATKVITQVLINSDSMRPAEKIIFSSSGASDTDTFDLSCLPKALQKTVQNNSELLVDGRERAVYSIEVGAKKIGP